jgi:hypothetical protein
MRQAFLESGPAKIGEIIANEPIRPSWHEGDFFGRTFAK